MTDARHEPADRTPTSNPVLRRALVWGGVLAAIVLVVSGILGLVFAGTEGLVSALIGTLMAVAGMIPSPRLVELATGPTIGLYSLWTILVARDLQ